jgi:hypothetical protein
MAASLTSTASAASLQCDASALRGTILGQGALEPVTANRGATACANTAAGGASAAQALAALPLNASVLGAATQVRIVPGANEKTAALAQGGLGNLTVKALPTLPITLPTGSIPAGLLTQTITIPPLGLSAPRSVIRQLPALPVPLPVPVPVPLPPVPVPPVPVPLPTLPPLSSLGPLGDALKVLLPSGQLTIDLKPAIDALLLGGRVLDGRTLLSVGAATAYAGASCASGTAKPFGATQVADIKIFGQTVPTDAAADQSLSLVDTSNIDLNALDITKVQLPASLLGGLTAPLLTQLQGLVKSLLTLPTVAVPATIANVKVTPSSQTIDQNGTHLVQRGPRIQVSIAGQAIADVILGEATVGTAGVNCTRAAAVKPPPRPTTPSDLALACTKRRLVLVDVLTEGSRVKLLGAADRKFAGQTVALRLASTGKSVATAKVKTDGSFSTYAPLPRKGIRDTNAARYQATLGKEKSLDLKLARRMIVSSLSAKAGRVTIAGRVTLPLTRPLASITLTRVVSCKKLETVTRFKPKRDGTFRITVAAPTGQDAAVYRLSTRVRRTANSKTTSPTFTLPRGVNLIR